MINNRHFSGLFNVFFCEAFQDLLIPPPIFPTTLTRTFTLFLFAIMNRPAPVEISYENMRFLITHNPTNATLKFTEELKKYGVTTLVRVCDATYDKAPVEKEGIHALDWPFDDGAHPQSDSR